MPTLLVTDGNLEDGEIAGLKGLQVDVSSWLGVANVKVADYETVILDTRVSEEYEGLSDIEGLFHAMQDDIETLLSAGGVVLVLAGPTLEIGGKRSERKLRETNYDFLPQVFQVHTALNYSSSRRGSRFDFNAEWSEYFGIAPTYYKTVRGISEGEGGPEFVYPSTSGRIIERVQLLASTKVTSQVVACLISWKGGTIGVLPPPNQLYVSTLLLVKRASEIYKRNLEQTRELLGPPNWVQDFKSAEQKSLEKEESGLKEKLKGYSQKINSLFLATSALFSTGKQLERAVTKIFSDLDWKFDDLTNQGQPIDYIVHGQRGVTDGLLIALTGSASYIDANHKKIAQLFGALAEVGEEQRLVFLVKALADEDPRSRTVEKCITDPARRRMAKHGICILLVPDLYRLWEEKAEGKRSNDQIFQRIHSTTGLYKVND